MRKTLLIAIREYNAAVRTKAFIVSVVLMPILMGGGIVAQRLLKGQVDTSDKKLAVVDRSGLVAERIVAAAAHRNQTETSDDTGKRVKPAYVIEIIPPDHDDPQGQSLALSERVRKGELHAHLEIGANVLEAHQRGPDSDIGYHAKNAALDDMRGWVAPIINNHLRELRMQEAKMDPELVRNVTHFIPVAALGLVSKDVSTGTIKQAARSRESTALLVPLAMLMLMFMMVMMGATPLLNSVLEEKMQRIAEVLLGSVQPFQLMMGKLLGTVGVSFTVVAIYVLGGVVAANRLGASDHVPFSLLPWFAVYQVAAIFMFGALFIAIGSACNDMKEAQSMMTPVMIMVCLPLFVWFQVIKEPLSSFSTAISFFPPCTPMLMLLRQATPSGVPEWQPWVGLAGVILFTLLCVWMSGRIFRVGLLMQGNPPRIRDLAKWAIRG